MKTRLARTQGMFTGYHFRDFFLKKKFILVKIVTEKVRNRLPQAKDDRDSFSGMKTLV